ncbi:unnamed protein product, partial [Closterium sp. NIES-54]
TQLPLQPASSLPAPSPYIEQSGGLTERLESASRPISPVCTARRVPRSHPPPVPGTHAMTLRPSFVLDPESDRACAASPTVARLFATAVTDPSFESAAASALVAELLDFAAACRLNYATSLVAESESDCPLSFRGECALGTDVLEDKQEDFECLASAVPRFASVLLAPEGDQMHQTSRPRALTQRRLRNRWMLMTKYHVDDMGAREKARLVVKGFTQVYGAYYDETYAPVRSYVTLTIFLSIVAVLDLHLMQLNMKNTFVQSKMGRVLYMYWPGVQAAEELVPAEAVIDARCHTDGRRLEEEPGRRGVVIQGRRRLCDVLGARLRRQLARRQQQHSDVEGAEGAAGGRL